MIIERRGVIKPVDLGGLTIEEYCEKYWHEKLGEEVSFEKPWFDIVNLYWEFNFGYEKLIKYGDPESLGEIIEHETIQYETKHTAFMKDNGVIEYKIKYSDSDSIFIEELEEAIKEMYDNYDR